MEGRILEKGGSQRKPLKKILRMVKNWMTKATDGSGVSQCLLTGLLR